MTLVRTLAVASLPTLIPAGAVRAQQPLVADRPDFTEGPVTVGLGAAQIELGYTFGRDRGGPTVTTHSLGEPLVRLGVFAEWLELRVGAGLVAQRTQISGGSLDENGFEDLYVGVKLALRDQNGVVPALGILPQAAEHYANTGLTWLLMDDLQWDIRVGVGLNDRAEDVFFGTGFALRLRRPQG